MRGGAVAARRAHNPKVLGSNPSPATKINLQRSLGARIACSIVLILILRCKMGAREGRQRCIASRCSCDLSASFSQNPLTLLSNQAFLGKPGSVILRGSRALSNSSIGSTFQSEATSRIVRPVRYASLLIAAARS